MMKPAVEAPPSLGWIFYDDSCGFCRRWVPFWEGALRKRGFRIAALQADWVQARLNLHEAELLQDLRLLLADGSQVEVPMSIGTQRAASGGRGRFTSSPSRRGCDGYLIGVIAHSLGIAITSQLPVD